MFLLSILRFYSSISSAEVLLIIVFCNLTFFHYTFVEIDVCVGILHKNCSIFNKQKIIEKFSCIFKYFNTCIHIIFKLITKNDNRNNLIFFLNYFNCRKMSSCDCAAASAGQTLAALCGGGQFMLFMGLLEVFIRSQCDLEDPCNRVKVIIHDV